MKKEMQTPLKSMGYFLIGFGIVILVYATYAVFQTLSGNMDLPYSSLVEQSLQSDNGIYRISGDFVGERDDFTIETSASFVLILVAISFAIVLSSVGAIAGTAISSGIKMIYPPQYWEKRTSNNKTNFSD